MATCNNASLAAPRPEALAWSGYTAFTSSILAISTAYVLVVSAAFSRASVRFADRHRQGSNLVSLLTGVPPLVVLVLGPLRDATEAQSGGGASWNCAAVLFFRFAFVPLTFIPVIFRVLRLHRTVAEQKRMLDAHIADVTKLDRALGVDEEMGSSSKAFHNGPFAPKALRGGFDLGAYELQAGQGMSFSSSAPASASSSPSAPPMTGAAPATTAAPDQLDHQGSDATVSPRTSEMGAGASATSPATTASPFKSSSSATPPAPQIVIKSFIPEDPIPATDSFQTERTYETVNLFTLFVSLAAFLPALVPPLVFIGVLPAYHPGAGAQAQQPAAPCPNAGLCRIGGAEYVVLAVLYLGFILVLSVLVATLPEDSLGIRVSLLGSTTVSGAAIVISVALLAAEAYGAVSLAFDVEWIVFAALMAPHLAIVGGRTLRSTACYASAARRAGKLPCASSQSRAAARERQGRSVSTAGESRPATKRGSEADATELPLLLAQREFNREFGYHLAREYASENLWFYNEIQLYKEAFPRIDASTRSWWAKKIALTFIGLRARAQINISQSLRSDVEAFFADAEKVKRVDEHVFDKCQAEVLGIMRGSFLTFAQQHPDLVRNALKSVNARSTPPNRAFAVAKGSPPDSASSRGLSTLLDSVKRQTPASSPAPPAAAVAGAGAPSHPQAGAHIV